LRERERESKEGGEKRSIGELVVTASAFQETTEFVTMNENYILVQQIANASCQPVLCGRNDALVAE
jgi:hypothetical protein